MEYLSGIDVDRLRVGVFAPDEASSISELFGDCLRISPDNDAHVAYERDSSKGKGKGLVAHDPACEHNHACDHDPNVKPGAFGPGLGHAATS
jgi:hypothetical protein